MVNHILDPQLCVPEARVPQSGSVDGVEPDDVARLHPNQAAAHYATGQQWVELGVCVCDVCVRERERST